MNKDFVISRVELVLGGQVLKLEVTKEDIAGLMELAYSKIRPFITDTKLITVPFAQVVDVKDKGIEDVVRAYTSDVTLTTSQTKMFDFEAVKLGDRRSIRRSIIGSYPVVENDIGFKFYDGRVYLDVDDVGGSSVTLECLYTPPIEELKDERASTWIEAYTLALSKEVCGRIRSKFKSSNVPVELDGETLLSEAQTEKQTLEAELQDRQFGPFMILR